ncbi:MAG TPA: 30S ribosomal protein S3, partial [Thiomicrospira sp.]|nr:30S ribosomal protein S3 [Thiomicrospira sp.]
MGQKVHPVGIRLGITKDWNARWYANSKDYADFLIGDIEIRKELEAKLSHASVSKITIERVANGIRVTIHTARPGVVIGKKGED